MANIHEHPKPVNIAILYSPLSIPTSPRFVDGTWISEQDQKQKNWENDFPILSKHFGALSEVSK